MHDEQNRTSPYGSKRNPPFFCLKGQIALSKCVRVVENQNGRFKANVVLAKVLPVLAIVPFKSHGRLRPSKNTAAPRQCQYSCMYSSGRKKTAQPKASGPDTQAHRLLDPRHPFLRGLSLIPCHLSGRSDSFLQHPAALRIYRVKLR